MQVSPLRIRAGAHSVAMTDFWKGKKKQILRCAQDDDLAGKEMTLIFAQRKAAQDFGPVPLSYELP